MSSPEQGATQLKPESASSAQPYVGTSGWAYKVWQPEFYPPKLAQSKFLPYYSSRLNTVEVNYTFRHLLSEKTINNWLQQTPEHFQFVLKANQRITHIKRLKDVDESLERFLSASAPLANAKRLGPVLFQLPPNMKAAPEVLDAFLAKLPKTLMSAFEFRHASWFSDETTEILTRHNAALCVAETEEFKTPEIHTAPYVYYRFRCSQYSDEARKGLAERVRTSLGEGRNVYAFFKHEESPESPLWAVELLESIRATNA